MAPLMCLATCYFDFAKVLEIAGFFIAIELTCWAGDKSWVTIDGTEITIDSAISYGSLISIAVKIIMHIITKQPCFSCMV